MNHPASVLQPHPATPAPLQPLAAVPDAPQTYRERVATYERGLIQEALAAANGNQTRAARNLRIPLRTLVYKLRALGIRAAERPPESFQALKQ